MNVAIGSSLSQMIGTGTTATLRHWKESAVDVKLAVILLGGTVGGVEIGAEILQHLKDLGRITFFHHEMEWVWFVPMCSFVVILLVVGVTTLVESLGAHRVISDGGTVPRRVGRGLLNRVHLPPMVTLAGTEGKPVSLLLLIYIGFVIGVTKGFLGLGGGILFVPVLIYWVGTSTRMAVGTSLLVVVLSSVSGTLSHGFRDNVSLELVMLILVSSTVGASLGAALHHRLKAHHVRLYFSFVLLAVLAVIAVKMLAEFGAFG
jgi:hypothetical protein